MRILGFSTGSIAQADFHSALKSIEASGAAAIELSALRENELEPLVRTLSILPLSKFSYISVHAPSRFRLLTEVNIVRLLKPVFELGYNVVVHPDAIQDFDLWMPFGPQVCIENMDNRKHSGRTAIELSSFFSRLPNSSLCFDIGHAWHIDRTMSEAELILKLHGSRLKQLHLSEVDSHGTHKPLTIYSIIAFQKVSYLIPPSIPIIIESVLSTPQSIQAELLAAHNSLNLAPV